MDDSILVELECPVCSDYLNLPIRQCVTGHSVCGKCCVKLDKCPICCREFSDSRNFTLEGLALKVKYPCVNKNDGCEERFTYAERDNHELNCSKGFKVACPMEGCGFMGDPRALKTHWLRKRTMFKDIHKDVVHLVNGYYKFDLMEAFDELFWFKMRTINDKIYFAMQYIGKFEKVKDFYYELEFSGKNNSINKLILSHSCSSIMVSDEMLFWDPYYSTIIGFDTIASCLSVRSHDGDQSAYTLKICRIGEGAQPVLKPNSHKKFVYQKGRRNNNHPKPPTKQNQSDKFNTTQHGQSNQKQTAKQNRCSGNKKKQVLNNDVECLIKL